MYLTPVKEITQKSDYKDKLLKLIPGEVIAAYITIEGIIPQDDPRSKWVSLFVALVLLIVIYPFLMQSYSVANKRQIYFTMGSFVIWLYSLGGPFALWSTALQIQLYVPFIGSVLLILWTLLIPLGIPSTPTIEAIEETMSGAEATT